MSRARDLADSADLSFDGSTLSIDSTNNRVGIGTASPSSALHVEGGSGSTIRNVASSGSSWFLGSNTSSYILHNISNTPMVFTTNGTAQMRLESSGDLKFNSGYGSVATAYGCRAWVNFQGSGTVAIRASGNVSSITDLDTGKHQVNFTTSMPDDDFVTQVTGDGIAMWAADSLATTKVRTLSYSGGSFLDYATMQVAVFR